MSQYREIYLVELMTQSENQRARTDPTGVYSSLEPQQQIGVYRRRVGEQCAPRIYRPYLYRSGLRFQRLLRILGRHR
jgi:hypothetical protein